MWELWRADRAHQSRAALELGAEASGESPANRAQRPGGRRCHSEAGADSNGETSWVAWR